MVMETLGITVISLYLLATLTYIAYFIKQGRPWDFAPSLVLALGAVLHFIYIVLLTKAIGRFPILSVFEVLTSATFLFASVYLILEYSIKDKSMGVLIAPILLFFQIIAVTGIDTAPKAMPPQLSQLSGLSFRIHVVFMLLAYSGFAIAFIASAMHLLLAREIHQKRLGFRRTR